MKNNFLWITLAVGAVGVGYYLYMRKKSNTGAVTSVSPPDITVTYELPQQEKAKYSPALLKEYDLVVPPFKANMKAEIAADIITAKRFQVDPLKVKSPLYI